MKQLLFIIICISQKLLFYIIGENKMKKKAYGIPAFGPRENKIMFFNNNVS